MSYGIQLTNSTQQLETYLADWQQRQGHRLLQQQHQQQHQQQQDAHSRRGDNSQLALALQQARALSHTSLRTAHVGVYSALASLYSCVGDLAAMTGAMQR